MRTSVCHEHNLVSRCHRIIILITIIIIINIAMIIFAVGNASSSVVFYEMKSQLQDVCQHKNASRQIIKGSMQDT